MVFQLKNPIFKLILLTLLLSLFYLFSTLTHPTTLLNPKTGSNLYNVKLPFYPQPIKLDPNPNPNNLEPIKPDCNPNTLQPIKPDSDPNSSKPVKPGCNPNKIEPIKPGPGYNPNPNSLEPIKPDSNPKSLEPVKPDSNPKSLEPVKPDCNPKSLEAVKPDPNPNSISLEPVKPDSNPKKSEPTLDFSSHHTTNYTLPTQNELKKPIKQCTQNFTNYCPCQDTARIRTFSSTHYFNRERHCPEYEYEKLNCLVRVPIGYRNPFPWPKSKDMAWYKNVPFKRLVVDKKKQNWVRLEGDLFVFPGGGTSFRKGVKGYVDSIDKVVNLRSGSVRTALDVGCGVATFGAALLDYNILTVSMAPLDTHEAQVQFALERGVPAMLGILSTYRLPFPSRAFDLAHCSRCLVNWTDNGNGLNLVEVDRVLRPGGYWVLSGPPISWRTSFKGWERPASELEKEQTDLENLTDRLCWKKVAEKGAIAVWQKPTNHFHCAQKLKKSKTLKFCEEKDPDSAWYRTMESCITPLPAVRNKKHTSGGTLEKWPKRLNVVPSRIPNSMIGAFSSRRTFNEDNQLWKRKVHHYATVLTSLSTGGYRNVMDMNAGLGGFASAMSTYPVWVMNVVPFDSGNNTLGAIYERGLIGTYMNWCEAFSTYPRTYDLIQADSVFSMYTGKCDATDILLEMYRILRPHGAVIVRDHVDVILKVKDIMENMGWKSRLEHSEQGPFHPQKVLFVDNTQLT